MSEPKTLTADDRAEAMRMIELPDDGKPGSPRRRTLRKLVARYEATLRESEERAMMSWECLTMARETLGTILDGTDGSGIAPMFLPEAIRSACYRAATGKLRDEVMPPDACSRVLAEIHERTRPAASPAEAAVETPSALPHHEEQS